MKIKKLCSLCLVLLMLAGMVSTVSAAVNLPKEYTFDSGVESWTASNASEFGSAQGYNGNGLKAVCYKDGVNSGNQVRVSQPGSDAILYKKGYTYTISAWMKAEKEGDALLCLNTSNTIKLNGWTATNDTLSTRNFNQAYPAPSFSLGTEWKKYIWTFTIEDITEKETKKTEVSSLLFVRLSSTTTENTIYIDEFSVVEVFGSQEGQFDLSKTEKTVLSVGDTSQLIVDKIVGDSVEPVVDEDGKETLDVSFISDNTGVAEVSETGLITAKKPGTAVIHASYLGILKSIIVIVGETKASKNFDSGSPGGGITQETTIKREGTGSWKISPNKSGYNPTLANAHKDGQVISYWFYDDGAEDYKGILLLQSLNDTNQKRINEWMRINNSNSGTYANRMANGGFSSDYTAFTIQRSKGWHQVVFISNGVKANCYIDGKYFYGGTIACGNPTITAFSYYAENSSATGVLYVDDFASVDITVKHNVTVSVGTNGTVKNGDLDVVSGEPIIVGDGGTVTLKVAPNEGYKAKVTVDGQEVAVQDDNTVTLSNITANKAVAVTFEKIIVTPEISGSDVDYIIQQDDYIADDGKEHFAYVSYYKAAIPETYTVNSLGMNFGDGTNTVSLPVNDWTSDYMFGIRVFGDAVKKGNPYTFQGFAVVEDGEGNESTITTGEPITK